MAVMFKKTNNVMENILSGTFSVPPVLIQKLKDKNVALFLGDKSISLNDNAGHKAEYSFNTLTNNAVKNPTSKHIIEISAFIAEYLNSLDTKPVSTPTVKASSTKTSPTKAMPKVATDAGLDVINRMTPVKLREATLMYQKVYGTSGGSIYRMVAFNDVLKVAVRINGESLSVRVEGDFTTEIVNKFAALGVQKKSDAYLSGHFTCDHSTPDRAIGAILTGVGLEFNSPLPNLAKIK